MLKSSLIDQCSSWTTVKTGVPQGSILGSLLFYNNDLAYGLSSNTKLCADDTSYFSLIHDYVITASEELKLDLAKIKQWSFQRRLKKFFSRKLKKDGIGKYAVFIKYVINKFVVILLN